MEYDFSDSLIKGMVISNHYPKEIFQNNGYVAYVDKIVCQHCNNTWPCRAIVMLRSWDAKNSVEAWRRDG